MLEHYPSLFSSRFDADLEHFTSNYLSEFRDQILKHLSTLPPNDFDAVAAKLDSLGNQLDYRKYEGPLFEVLLVGGILAPGGSYVDDGAERSPFSIITSTTYPIDQPDMKKHVDVFNKLIRRSGRRS